MNDQLDERGDEGAGELADGMEREAERMDRRTDELEGEISSAKSGWESKQGDATVPGAQDESTLRDDVEDEDDADTDVVGTVEDETETSEDAS